MLREWRLLRDCLSLPIFSYRGTDEGDDKTYAHFMKLLGFQYTGQSIECLNGVSRPLYVSVKNG